MTDSRAISPRVVSRGRGHQRAPVVVAWRGGHVDTGLRASEYDTVHPVTDAYKENLFVMVRSDTRDGLHFAALSKGGAVTTVFIPADRLDDLPNYDVWDLPDGVTWRGALRSPQFRLALAHAIWYGFDVLGVEDAS